MATNKETVMRTLLQLHSKTIATKERNALRLAMIALDKETEPFWVTQARQLIDYHPEYEAITDLLKQAVAFYEGTVRA